MATSESAVAVKKLKNKTSARLLPEALAVDWHVLEDDVMIQTLGREKFVELCIYGSQGWQQGVSTPSHTFSNFFVLYCSYVIFVYFFCKFQFSFLFLFAYTPTHTAL